eukprot:g3770.t1
MRLLPLLLLVSTATLTAARTYDLIKDGGAVPDVETLAAAWTNGGAFNKTLEMLEPGDTLLVPNRSFYLMGGIMGSGKVSVTILIEGTLTYSNDIKAWPRRGDGQKAGVQECMHLWNMTNLTITGGSEMRTIFGSGQSWWGLPGIGYLERQENRPRMLKISDSKDVLVERLFFKDPPYWTTVFENMDGLEIRYSKIEAYRVSKKSHSPLDLTAFNTDGFDFTGRNIHIHHCDVWNQDDSFCVKDNTENVVIEHVTSSGLGLTIGSISSNVRNITFRNIYMPNTYKGIYMKFRGNGNISDVLYENIVMDEPEQYAVWIGPAQQSDSNDLCAAHPCSICWPTDPWAKCDAPSAGFYRNITLRNITINSPKGNPGVILASPTAPMADVTFEDVVINHPSTKKTKWGTNYLCENVASGVATGKTSPVPPCFKDMTEAGSAAAAAAVEQR